MTGNRLAMMTRCFALAALLGVAACAGRPEVPFEATAAGAAAKEREGRLPTTRPRLAVPVDYNQTPERRAALAALEAETAPYREAMAGCRAQSTYHAYLDPRGSSAVQELLLGESFSARRVRLACEAAHRAYGTPGF